MFFQIKVLILEERDSGSGGTSRVAATHQARGHDDLHYISSLLHLFKACSGLAEIFYIRFQGCEHRAKICDLILLFCANIKHRQSKYLTTFSNYPEGNSVLS